jgi:hypothetical protein
MPQITKPILILHLSGKVIRTTADHPFFVQGQGWTEAADLRAGDLLLTHDGQPMPVEGITNGGEQEVVYSLNPGVQAMPDQSRRHFPILGIAAGTPLLTPEGHKPIEELRPGDVIQTQPDEDQGHDKPDAHDDGHAGDERRWWEEN